MINKLKFLTKMSLSKKIKTKWFLIANLIFGLLIIGLINVDSIIKIFGGDFNDSNEILIIDNINCYDIFKSNYDNYIKYTKDINDIKIDSYNGTYDEGVELVKNDKKILLVIDNDDVDYLKVKLVSNSKLDMVTETLINSIVKDVRSQIVMNSYNITYEEYENINKMVNIESVILDNNDSNDDMIIVTLMEIITIPIFMLIIFLVQMVGASVNEEKTTKSMEIIISNVSPKVHFASKIISSNVFVIIQGLILILFVFIGLIIRYIVCDGNLFMNIDSEVNSIINSLSITKIISSIERVLPIIIIMLLLTFIAYSLLAGILASMTTNMEDYQQLQTPIVIISLVGFYLSMMASMFKGSIFIKIMSYIPLISAFLAPTLYILGDISIIDICISILLLIGTIYIFIKYGLRIYKAGILNYSQSNLFKKMIKAVKEK